jgi:hypothetical protein
MGFTDNDNSGIGNTNPNQSPSTPSLSGMLSSDQVDIYNYNKITLHFSTGDTWNTANNAAEHELVMTQQGCYFNGQPMWTYEDGTYDGDGTGICQGKSHQLRYAGDGAPGQWEFVSHGYISAWTSASTLNFFNIQGSGSTGGDVPATNPTIGGWINWTGTTDSYPYGRLRAFNLAAGGVGTYDAGGITAVTSNGTIE